MKQIQTPELVLTLNPDWQTKPFLITGPAEAVTPIADRVQANDARRGSTRRSESTDSPTNRIVEKMGSIASNVAENVNLARFDRRHNTDLLAEKQERARLIAIARKRNQLGWTAVDSCAKHRHLMDSLRG